MGKQFLFSFFHVLRKICDSKIHKETDKRPFVVLLQQLKYFEIIPTAIERKTRFEEDEMCQEGEQKIETYYSIQMKNWLQAINYAQERYWVMSTFEHVRIWQLRLIHSSDSRFDRRAYSCCKSMLFFFFCCSKWFILCICFVVRSFLFVHCLTYCYFSSFMVLWISFQSVRL